MKKWIHTVCKTCLIGVFSLFIISCTHQIYTPTGNIPSGLTEEQIYDALVKTSLDCGWLLEKGGNADEFYATRYVRQSSAKIKILIVGNTYGIYYTDSYNLRYDKEDETISGHYNKWVTVFQRILHQYLVIASDDKYSDHTVRVIK